MKKQGRKQAKKDYFPYFVLLGVVVVALLAGAFLSGIHFNTPTQNVVGSAYQDTETLDICGKTLFVDDRDTPNTFELYSEDLATGEIIKLSGPLQANGRVWSFNTTPDGRYVIYKASLTLVSGTHATTKLYAVPLNGGIVIPLSPAVETGAVVLDFSSSHNSEYVAYTVKPASDGANQLFVVPITGGPSVQVSQLASQFDVWTFAFTPNDQRLVYISHQTTNGQGSVYSVLSTGGASVRLSNAGERVTRDKLMISCDSQTAYYLTQASDPPQLLYSVPTAGGPGTVLTGLQFPTQSCPPPAPTCEEEIADPSDLHIFIDDRDTPNKDELYSENTVTDVITKISGMIPNDEDVTSFQVTTDGQRVVYRVGKQMAEGSYTGGNWQLYSVPSNGGTAVRISGPMQPQGGVGLFRVAPDGTRVAYTADATNNTAMELYSVPILGGAVSSLSGPMRTYFDSPTLITSNVISLFISPNSQRVVYTADMGSWTMYEAYSVPITGGANTHINHVLPADHDVEGIVIAPNSQRVVYRAVRTSLGKGELYSVPIGGGTAVRISQAWNPPSFIDVEFDGSGLGAVVSCDSQTVYYLADTIADGSRDELYSVPIGSGQITPLTGSTLPTITCATNSTTACSAIGVACVANPDCCSNACSNSHCVSMNPGSGNSSAPTGFAPAIDPIDGATYLAASTSASGVQVSANGNNGRYVWRIGYYLKDAQWQPFQFSATGIAGTNWTNGSLNAALPAGAPTSGYAIIYACKKYPGRTNYTCGPRNATSPSSERRWTIVQYQTTTTGCTDDCATGSTMCASTQVRLCGNYDADTCREWSDAQSCPSGQTCQGSACATTGSGDTRPMCNTQLRTACSASQFAGSSPRSDLSCRCQISPCPPPQQCYQCPEGQTAAYNTTTHTYRCSAAGSATPVDVPRYMGGIDGLDWSARVQNGVQTGGACNTNVNCTGYDAPTNGCFLPGAHQLAWACAYGSGQTMPALYKCDASHNNQEMSTGGTNKVCCKQTGSTYAFETGPCSTTPTPTEERHGVQSPIDPTKSSCWDGVDNDQDGAFDLQGGAGSLTAEGTDCDWPWNADIEAPASVVKGATFSAWCSSTFGWQFTQHAGPKLSGSGGTMDTFAVWDATKGKYRSDFTAGASCTFVTVVCGTDKASIVTTNPLSKDLDVRIPCQDPTGG